MAALYLNAYRFISSLVVSPKIRSANVAIFLFRVRTISVPSPDVLLATMDL